MRLHGWNTHERHWIYLISLVVELILQTETQISIKIRIEHFSSVFASLLCSCQIEWFVHSGISVVWFTLIRLYFVFITFDFHLMTMFGKNIYTKKSQELEKTILNNKWHEMGKNKKKIFVVLISKWRYKINFLNWICDCMKNRRKCFKRLFNLFEEARAFLFADVYNINQSLVIHIACMSKSNMKIDIY